MKKVNEKTLKRFCKQRDYEIITNDPGYICLKSKIDDDRAIILTCQVSEDDANWNINVDGDTEDYGVDILDIVILYGIVSTVKLG